MVDMSGNITDTDAETYGKAENTAKKNRYRYGMCVVGGCVHPHDSTRLSLLPHTYTDQRVCQTKSYQYMAVAKRFDRNVGKKS